MKRDDLLTRIKAFPDKPGVYLMHDSEGKIIYVGKAKSLKKRVSSYFRHANFASPRLRKLVDSICDISTIRTESEVEALILENKLIKLYQPFFNVDLKMNERYPYLKITHEKYPRLLVTRHMEKNDDSIYIGPFVRVYEVRELLRLIDRYMPLRSCNGELRGSPKNRPCMRHALGKCMAPCAGLCGEAEYRDRAADIIMLLQGNGAELVEKFRKCMDKAASKLDFEKAARLRDTIRAIWRYSRQRKTIPDLPSARENFLETLTLTQKIFNLPTIPWRIDGFDISHTAGNETVGVVVVFEQGFPNPSLYRRFNIKDVEGIDDFRSMRETLRRRYQKALDGEEPLPQLILIDGGSVQLEFAVMALRELGITSIPVISLAKEFEEVYLPGVKEPVRLDHSDPALRLLQYVRDEAHRYAITSHRKKRGKAFTRSKLEDVPGIGRMKAAQLITKFGSAKAILEAPEDQLAATPGIGSSLAKRIIAALSERTGSE